jgi:hypothetical protein
LGKIFFSNGKEIFQTLLSFIAIICAIQCIFESEHIARKPLKDTSIKVNILPRGIPETDTLSISIDTQGERIDTASVCNPVHF